MNNNEVLTQFQNAKIFYKKKKKVFNRFFPVYKIVNSRITEVIHTVCIIAFVGSIIIASLDFFSVIGDINEIIRKCILIIFLISAVILGSLGMLTDKQDTMYEKYLAADVIAEMYNYMCGLNYVFWNKKDIKDLIKVVSSGRVSNLQEAAIKVKPKCKKLFFDADRFKKISSEAIERQNREIQKRNKKTAKKEQKKMISDAVWGAVVDSVADAFLSSITGGTSAEISSVSYDSSTRGTPAKPVDNSKKKAEEERQRQLADYAKQADWWESEYRRLYAWDPNHYKTKDAEYNKNYFRRLSRG